MAIQIGLYVSDSFAPTPLKIGPLSPYIEPNDPRGGIFALGNMCLHKPCSDGDLWVPLKFCHQGGARGPLDYILWSISRISIEYNTRYIMLRRVEMDMLTMTRHILDMSPATHPPVSNWSVIDSCWQVAVHVWLVLDINHCFRKCLAACLAPRYLLSQCWEINYWTRWVIFQ